MLTSESQKFDKSETFPILTNEDEVSRNNIKSPSSRFFTDGF